MGSPVGTLPAHTKVLSIENVYDQVTAAEGAPNRDAPAHTTVVIDPERTSWLGSRARAWQGKDPSAAHAVSAYVGAGYQLDGLANPSVNAYRQAQQDVLGGVTRASTQVFQGTRVPEPVCTTSPVIPLPGPAGLVWTGAQGRTGGRQLPGPPRVGLLSAGTASLLGARSLDEPPG